MAKKAKGTLIIIGGHENKRDDRVILEEVARHAKAQNGRLVITTVASSEPDGLVEQYTALFRDLGVRQVDGLDIRSRGDAKDEERLKLLREAGAVFFTGGDQLRITSQIGDSPVFQMMRELHREGGLIAGTSAGAAAMSETMLVSGAGDESNEISALNMASGLGFIEGIVIDSHFAERGRIGRLLGAVAQNPKNLGLGIDEDTAVVVEGEDSFRVLGSGAVYVVDGSEVSYSSLSEDHPEGVLSIFNVRMHVLAEGRRFDLKERRPIID